VGGGEPDFRLIVHLLCNLFFFVNLSLRRLEQLERSWRLERLERLERRERDGVNKINV